jgi:hypothetical protein
MVNFESSLRDIFLNILKFKAVLRAFLSNSFNLSKLEMVILGVTF